MVEARVKGPSGPWALMVSLPVTKVLVDASQFKDPVMDSGPTVMDAVIVTTVSARLTAANKSAKASRQSIRFTGNNLHTYIQTDICWVKKSRAIPHPSASSEDKGPYGAFVESDENFLHNSGIPLPQMQRGACADGHQLWRLGTSKRARYRASLQSVGNTFGYREKGFWMAKKPKTEPAPPIGEKLLTLREAAKVLRLNPRTVRDYVQRGEIEGESSVEGGDLDVQTLTLSLRTRPVTGILLGRNFAGE